ncbi:hypothetical protein [Ralstonia pseudosolanacearum]|uniref:hypothetical protein n=1 Tax=Ralstonia pseudosolanacearum TaxID=1310165 RepID=UPI003CFA03AD
MTKVDGLPPSGSAKSLRIHGFVEDDALSLSNGSSAPPRKAVVKIALPVGYPGDPAGRLSAEQVEQLWTSCLEENLEANELAGAIDWVQVLDDCGRVVHTGRLRFGSMWWEPAEGLTTEQAAASRKSAEALETDASRAYRAGDLKTARRKSADAAFHRSLVDSVRFSS